MVDLSNPSTKARMTITLATALALGAVSYGHMFDLGLTGVLGIAYRVSGPVIYLAAAVGVFVVYRWWALLPAVAPILVSTYVREFTDYVSPWREEFGRPSDAIGFVILATLGVLLQAAFLSLGLLARALWERRRAKRLGRSMFGAT